ncbi:hypothetical protein RHMOL_Rhmol03G0009200 [Rhododendron molle]|uniref:Uncharacterized protein n=1 Tax=Rhododendron molle TaxID=49168 RepID=A0ACC0P9K9_RHOML|nr:hypothetical protein RHMOL_Rhmol03G0009200 [Rhododendron molle]
MVRIGVHDCTIVRVMVLKTDAVGYIQRVEKAKVVVFSGGVDTSATETKGTMQIHSAEQLEKYSKTGAAKVEELIKAVAESGAKVVVSGGAVGEMALHFCERYKLMVLRISSKFELQRFCRTTGAVAILKLGRPNPNDLGYVDSVSVEEIGGVRIRGLEINNCGSNLRLFAVVMSLLMSGKKDAMLSGNIAEAKAFLEDINCWSAQGFTNVNVFKDSLLLVKFLSSKFSFFSVVEVSRSGSQTAHLLFELKLSKSTIDEFVNRKRTLGPRGGAM